jgi:hypothetical protein
VMATSDMGIRLKPWLRGGLAVGLSLLIVLVALLLTQIGGTSSNSTVAIATTNFNYGFDLAQEEPDPTDQDAQARSNNPAAVASALGVLSKFSGSIVDQSINSFGAGRNPQPRPVRAPALPDPSNTNLSSIAARLKLITRAGGVPMITLIQAPAWMYTGCTEGSVNGNEDINIDSPKVKPFQLPPCPENYQSFANLAAYIAQSFPQVRYFLVWSEMRDFNNPATKTYDAASYTTMYNDVYTAIKKVRPDAMIGGPYASMTAYATEQPGAATSTLHGDWGWLDPNMQNVLAYWLKNKVGAQFIAIDGRTEVASVDVPSGGAQDPNGNASITDPVTASGVYAAVDQWIKSQSSLPIWWIESHIAPTAGWTEAQGAAARVATLALMNSSQASVGMQWQPQEESNWPDEGLWTTTEAAGGGKRTALADDLLRVLPILKQPMTIISRQPRGVLAASEGSHLLLVNTNNASATSHIGRTSIPLGPGAVVVEPIADHDGRVTAGNQPAGGSADSSGPNGGALAVDSSSVTAQESGEPGSSSGQPIESPTVTLRLPAVDAGKITNVVYSIDHRTLTPPSSSPLTYRVTSDHLPQGCHELTLSYVIDGASETSSRRLCIGVASLAWYQKPSARVFGAIALFIVALIVLWQVFGLRRFARWLSQWSFGRRITSVSGDRV